MLLVPGLVTPPPSFSFLPPPRLQPQVLFLFFWNPVCTKLARALACGWTRGAGKLDSQSKVLRDPGILSPWFLPSFLKILKTYGVKEAQISELLSFRQVRF